MQKFSLFYNVVISFFRFFFKFFYRYSVYGIEHIEPGGGIIAPNHVSYLDPPLVTASCPEEVHALAKEPLFRIPILSWIIRKLHAHPVGGTAKDITVFKQVERLIKEEKKVLLFPEGTRAFSNVINPMQRGIGLIIARSQSRVYPTYIHGAISIWHRKKKWPKFRGEIACVFGSPIDWEEYSHLSSKEAQKELLKTLKSSLENLKEWYEDGHRGTPP